MITNQIKTFALLLLLSGLIFLIGGLLGGRTGLIFALILALGINFFSYFYSHKIVLAMYKAKDLPKKNAPEIHAMVERISKKAGISKPKIYLIPSDNPNAFATGRNPQNAVIAFTSGIAKILTKKELEGVLAHEIGHVKNRDILISTIAATLATVIMYIASMARFAAIFGGSRDSKGNSNIIQILALSIIAPIAAMLIQFAISRSREFIADETSAMLTGEPKHLASALQKLEDSSRKLPMRMGGQSTASLFIINPFSGAKMAKLFSTHPLTQDRISRLNSMKF